MSQRNQKEIFDSNLLKKDSNPKKIIHKFLIKIRIANEERHNTLFVVTILSSSPF